MFYVFLYYFRFTSSSARFDILLFLELVFFFFVVVVAFGVVWFDCGLDSEGALRKHKIQNKLNTK
jgi:hypothetical protein